MNTNLNACLMRALNENSAENGSDTPDFILAAYLMKCLEAYDHTVHHREQFYGRPCGSHKTPCSVEDHRTQPPTP